MKTLYQVLSWKEKLLMYGLIFLAGLGFYNAIQSQFNSLSSLQAVIILSISSIPFFAFLIITDRKYRKKGKKKRRSFSIETKEEVLKSQNYRCRHCYKPFEHTSKGIGFLCDFDHIHGRNDNSVDNCQALCPNCHARKTREL